MIFLYCSRAGGGGAATGALHLAVRRAVPLRVGHLFPSPHGDVCVLPGQFRSGPRAALKRRSVVYSRRCGAGGRHVYSPRRNCTLLHAEGRRAQACLGVRPPTLTASQPASHVLCTIPSKTTNVVSVAVYQCLIILVVPATYM